VFTAGRRADHPIFTIRGLAILAILASFLLALPPAQAVQAVPVPLESCTALRDRFITSQAGAELAFQL